jgi:S1-C subfamily serine protease
MYKIMPLSKRQRWLPHTLLVLGIICLNILGLLGSAVTTYASAPGGNVADPVIRAVDIAKPAIVRIITFVDGRLTVRFSSNQNVTFPLTGNPYQLTLSGSGAFISAKGDILTADHVINPPAQDLNSFLDQLAAQDVTNYYNQHSNTQVTQDQITQALTSGQLPSNGQYGTPSSQVYLSTDYTGPLSATNVQNIPQVDFAMVDHIEQQSPVNDKDVAIIHVNNMNDMASVQLDDSSTVQSQDQLTIIGFPGNGDVSSRPTDLLTSSINTVTVSSTGKTTDTGAPLIQVSGNVEHGDSGGPALDSSGNVVGIVSFGTAQPGNTSFLQASNSARGLVQAQHLDTTPGQFETKWKQAFIDYAANTSGHWHKALQKFEQLAANYPAFKAITQYLNYAKAQAMNEPLSQTQSQPQSSSSFLNGLVANKWVILGAGAVILLVLLLFAGVMLRRRWATQVPNALTMGQPFNAAPTVASSQMGQNRGMNPMYGMQQQPQPQPQSQQSNSLGVFGGPPRPAAGPWPAQQPGQPMPGYGHETRTIPGSQTWPAPRAPVQAPSNPANNPYNPNNPAVPANTSGALVPWPCGHMNRPVARYCSVCGEPAPSSPTIRRYEQ